MRENTDQKNPKYKHFVHSGICYKNTAITDKSWVDVIL